MNLGDYLIWEAIPKSYAQISLALDTFPLIQQIGLAGQEQLQLKLSSNKRAIRSMSG